MSGAAELFVVALARASQRAQKYLRGLEPADRDDILSTAILWCWENKANYRPTISLEVWVTDAIRHAKRDWERQESRETSELIEAIAAPDDTSWNAAIQDAIRAMMDSMDERDRSIVTLMLDGKGQDHIATQVGLSVSGVKRRLTRLRKFLPESAHFKLELRKVMSDSDRSQEPQSGIDKDIERLEFMPQHGKDCPPCWRCKWFEGLLPGPHRTVRLPIVEPEIRAAMNAIEGKKVEIAMLVQAGTINE